MGWGIIRRQKFDLCNGLCEWCGGPIKNYRNSVLHHKVNRKQGGKFTLENAELRHPHCEAYAHAHFPFGNREGNLKRGRKNETNRRKRSENTQQMRWPERLPERDGHGAVGANEYSITIRYLGVEISIRSLSPELPKIIHGNIGVQSTPAEVGSGY